VREHYEAAPGYANFWFNRYHQQRIWNGYLAHGDFADAGWNWKIQAKTVDGNRAVEIDLTEKAGSIVMPDAQSGVEFGSSLMGAIGPPRSGGLLAALHLWQRILLLGPRKFGEVYYLGEMPWKTDDQLADCLVATHAGVETRFYFERKNSNLVGIEFFSSDEEDPCEITFDDIRPINGRSLPHHWTIRLGEDTFAEFNVTEYQFTPHSDAPATKKQ
jgi:serine protease Do